MLARKITPTYALHAYQRALMGDFSGDAFALISKRQRD
jgi:hypothetical protein